MDVGNHKGQNERTAKLDQAGRRAEEEKSPDDHFFEGGGGSIGPASALIPNIMTLAARDNPDDLDVEESTR